MRKGIIKIKLIAAQGKCLKCGFESMLYFTSDNRYGERIVSTKNGKYCAFVKHLNENTIQELEEYCTECFSRKGVKVSKSELMRIVSNIYRITCDNVFDEKIYTMPNTKCVNCRKKLEYGISRECI